jgi:hypothetical protein
VYIEIYLILYPNSHVKKFVLINWAKRQSIMCCSVSKSFYTYSTVCYSFEIWGIPGRGYGGCGTSLGARGVRGCYRGKFFKWTWILWSQDCRRIETSQMRFLRAVAGVTLRARIRSEDVRKRLQTGNVVEDIKQYQSRWLHCMSPERLPWQAYVYTPTGRRDLGRPRTIYVSKSRVTGVLL